MSTALIGAGFLLMATIALYALIPRENQWARTFFFISSLFLMIYISWFIFQYEVQDNTLAYDETGTLIGNATTTTKLSDELKNGSRPLLVMTTYTMILFAAFIVVFMVFDLIKQMREKKREKKGFPVS